MKQIILLISLTFASLSFTYDKDFSEPNGETTEFKSYRKPQFPGGERMLSQYLLKSITYPQEAIKKRIQGKVYAEFTVEIDGSISGVKIYRGIGGGCDKETIRVIKDMPKWIPAEQKGKKIKVKQALPVQFYLPRKER